MTFPVAYRWWFGGLWQDGVRKEEGRKGELCIISSVCPMSSIISVWPSALFVPVLVEQEEREGWDVSAQSVYRREPEAGPVSGGTGEKNYIYLRFFQWKCGQKKQNQDKTQWYNNTILSNNKTSCQSCLNIYYRKHSLNLKSLLSSFKGAKFLKMKEF